uniref:Uncharacterized protein n=1 Tax=Arundo donax TaxID=35708 RepID=A0A0A8Z588_ARUDO
MGAWAEEGATDAPVSSGWRRAAASR